MLSLWLERVLDLVYPPRCAGCRRRGAVLCPPCRSRCTLASAAHLLGPDNLPLDGLFVFDGPLRGLVHGLKYERQRRLARPLAALVAEHCPWRPQALAPVPLFAERQRERGFNQSAEIAVELGRLWQIPVCDQLVRVRSTGQQVGRSRAERLANVAGAFVWTGPLPDGPIAVLDDVLTTGATLGACLAALKAAGAADVRGLAVARA